MCAVEHLYFNPLKWQIGSLMRTLLSVLRVSRMEGFYIFLLYCYNSGSLYSMLEIMSWSWSYSYICNLTPVGCHNQRPGQQLATLHQPSHGCPTASYTCTFDCDHLLTCIVTLSHICGKVTWLWMQDVKRFAEAVTIPYLEELWCWVVILSRSSTCTLVFLSGFVAVLWFRYFCPLVYNWYSCQNCHWDREKFVNFFESQ